MDLAKGSVPDEADPATAYFTTGGVAMIECTCLDLLDEEPRSPLAAVTATCLGHLARLHGSLRNSRRVLETPRALLADPDVGGRCQDALDDIAMFATHTPAAKTTWVAWTREQDGDPD